MIGPKTDLKQMQALELTDIGGHFNPYQGLNFRGKARDETHF